MIRKIRKVLIEKAKAQTTITYSELGSLVGLDMENIADRNTIAEVLGEISWAEHEKGNPLLSAVVVHAHDMFPGNGFFELARGARIKKRFTSKNYGKYSSAKTGIEE